MLLSNVGPFWADEQTCLKMTSPLKVENDIPAITPGTGWKVDGVHISKVVGLESEETKPFMAKWPTVPSGLSGSPKRRPPSARIS